MKKILAIWVLASMPLVGQAADNYAAIFKAHGTYQEVRDQAQSAIEGKGLKINTTHKISDMLDRTGKDIGASKRVYENAEQFDFCSAEISRKMMEADPHAIAMCPYLISVYKLPQDKHVYISYRRPAVSKNQRLKKVLVEVDKMMADIIKEAM